jgi:hypothetical protein
LTGKTLNTAKLAPEDQRVATISQINEKYTPFGVLTLKGVLIFGKKRPKLNDF